MTQPIGNCPGCGGDEPFEQVHANDQCPDAGGECPEWVCSGCGAGIFMGTVVTGTPTPVADRVREAGEASAVPGRQSVRAA